MTDIEYIKGDLFTTDCKYMAHGVNCQGVMGSGVAKGVRDKFPLNYLWYHNHTHDTNERYHGDSKYLLGQILFHNEHGKPELELGKLWFHCYTQNLYGRDGSRFVNYDAVYSAFKEIALIHSFGYKTYTNSFFEDFEELAMPKIGAGLGGGDWDIIELMIKKTLCAEGVTVKVYELE